MKDILLQVLLRTNEQVGKPCALCGATPGGHGVACYQPHTLVLPEQLPPETAQLMVAQQAGVWPAQHSASWCRACVIEAAVTVLGPVGEQMASDLIADGCRYTVGMGWVIDGQELYGIAAVVYGNLTPAQVYAAMQQAAARGTTSEESR